MEPYPVALMECMNRYRSLLKKNLKVDFCTAFLSPASRCYSLKIVRPLIHIFCKSNFITVKSIWVKVLFPPFPAVTPLLMRTAFTESIAFPNLSASHRSCYHLPLPHHVFSWLLCRGCPTPSRALEMITVTGKHVPAWEMQLDQVFQEDVAAGKDGRQAQWSAGFVSRKLTLTCPLRE